MVYGIPTGSKWKSVTGSIIFVTAHTNNRVYYVDIHGIYTYKVAIDFLRDFVPL